MKLSKSLFIFTIIALVQMQQSVFAQTSADRAEVASAVNGITIHFFHKDMKAFGKLWANDAVFITVGGIKADGRDAIVDMHSMGDYIVDKSTVVKLEPPIINFVDKDIAVAYSVWGGLVFKFGEKKMPVQSGYLTAVLRRFDDGWKIVSATNAANYDNHQPYTFEEYTPDLWRKWGIPRPDGLPLSKKKSGGS